MATHVRRLCFYEQCFTAFFYASRPEISEQRAYITSCAFTNLEHFTLPDNCPNYLGREDVVLLAIELFPKLRSVVIIHFMTTPTKEFGIACAQLIQKAALGTCEALHFDHYKHTGGELESFCIGVRSEMGDIRHVSITLGKKMHAEKHVSKYLQVNRYECESSISIDRLLRMDINLPARTSRCLRAKRDTRRYTSTRFIVALVELYISTGPRNIAERLNFLNI